MKLNEITPSEWNRAERGPLVIRAEWQSLKSLNRRQCGEPPFNWQPESRERARARARAPVSEIHSGIFATLQTEIVLKLFVSWASSNIDRAATIYDRLLAVCILEILIVTNLVPIIL